MLKLKKKRNYLKKEKQHKIKTKSYTVKKKKRVSHFFKLLFLSWKMNENLSCF
jgi:hypothetical protein